MSTEGISRQHLLRDHRLRRRHQRGVRRDRVTRKIGGLAIARIGPIGGELPRPDVTAQQRDRILQIVVQHRMMLDHGDNARIAPQGRAERTETIAATTATLQQLQRDRRIKQHQRRIGRQRQTRCQFCQTQRTIRQLIEQLQTDACEQNLRIDEAGAKIEQLARPPPRNRPRQRKTACKSLKSGIGEDRIAPVQQPIMQRQPRHAVS